MRSANPSAAGRDLGLRIQIVLAMGTAWLLLRALRLSILLRWLSVARRPFPEPRLHTVVTTLDRWLGQQPGPPHPGSAVHALVLYHYALRAGLPVQLRCGVGFTGRALDGHAHVMLRGSPFGVGGADSLGGGDQATRLEG